MRRIRRALAVTALLIAAMLLGPAPSASAHPLGNFTINLYSGLVIQPGRLTVDYVLDMAEIPTFQELPRIDANDDGVYDRAERSAYAKKEAGSLASGLVASEAGRPVALRVSSVSVRFRPGQAGLRILRLQAVLTGRLPATSGHIAYEDRNFRDRVGWREITATGADGAAVVGSSVPARSVSDALLRYPTDLLSSPLHVTSASLGFMPGASGAAPGFPRAAGGKARPLVTGGAFARLATWSGVSVWVFLLAMALAIGFGAAHALLPGHGKTIMATYLVGAGGRLRQAAQVGAAVAAMHTVSVIALGATVFALARFAPDRAYPWITLASGVFILALGGGLFLARMRNPGDQHRHAHDHGHTHQHESEDRPLSRRRLAGLAAAGGILPSPTAVVVLVSTFTTHRAAFGLSLIVGFSLGLAAALVGVGIVALRARTFVARKLGGRFLQLAPMVSAAVIVVFGAYFVARGATGITG